MSESHKPQHKFPGRSVLQQHVSLFYCSVVRVSLPRRKQTDRQTECMMGVKRLLLVCLLAALQEVALVASSRRSRSMPGSPYDISRDDHGLQQVVLTAARSYNNQSNDAFLFKPSAIFRAQRQIVKGVRYIVDLEISRTVCHKRDNNNLIDCDFQPEGQLHQTVQCHFEVWLIPWQNKTESQVLLCKP